MRKFLLAVAFLLGILFVISRFSEVQNIANTLRAGNVWYILLAVFIEGLWLLTVNVTWQRIYRIVGVEMKRWHLFQIVNAANFANTVAPTGGASIIAIFIDDARKRGISSARVAVAYAMNLLFDFTGMLVILVFGLTEMIERNNIHWPEITASTILFAAAVGLAAILFLAMRSSNQLARFLTACTRGINRILRPFLHREYLAIERARSFAAEAADAVKVLRENLRGLWPILILSIANKLLLLMILLAGFWTFNVPFTGDILVAGFSIGYLFVIVSPTPMGIGFMEGAMTLSLATLGISVEASAVITLTFRCITFWVPFLIGMVSIRHLESKGKAESARMSKNDQKIRLN